jgi:hypothetical protein
LTGKNLQQILEASWDHTKNAKENSDPEQNVSASAIRSLELFAEKLLTSLASLLFRIWNEVPFLGKLLLLLALANGI